MSLINILINFIITFDQKIESSNFTNIMYLNLKVDSCSQSRDNAS